MDVSTPETPAGQEKTMPQMAEPDREMPPARPQAPAEKPLPGAPGAAEAPFLLDQQESDDTSLRTGAPPALAEEPEGSGQSVSASLAVALFLGGLWSTPEKLRGQKRRPWLP